VDVYQLTERGTVRSQLQAAAARGFSKFVGRDIEMMQLQRALEQTQDGRGQAVAIVGDPGVGKSRLVFELTHSHDLRSWLVLEARSVSYGKGTAFLPVIDLLKSYFGIGDRETPLDIQKRVTAKTLALSRALEPMLPALLTLLDVPIDDRQWQELDAPERRQRTMDAVKRLLLREAQVQPVLVAFEDLHWIDSETETVLDGLIDSLPATRLLLLVNYRPEYRHGWGNKMYYTQLRLDTLLPESTGELLDDLLGPRETLQPLKSLLAARAGGNPFFIEEGVRTLVETKALLGERGAYDLDQPVEMIQVPATVQAVLAARIDRLPPGEKRLLEIAAVIGKNFPLALLQEVADETEETLRRSLAQLTTAEFLYEQNLSPDPEYTFKHSLTHEVAYRSLLRARRRDLHARIAEAMERLYADRLAEQVERLAQHALRGELQEKAVGYLRQAGLRAMARGANREAIAHLEQALGAVRHLPEIREATELIIDIHLDLRAALHPLDEHVRAEGHLHEAEGLARTLGDQRRLGRIATFMVPQCRVRGDYDEAVRFGREALNIARALGDRSIEVVARFFLGRTYVARGEFSDAATLLEQNVALEGAQRYERFGTSFIPSALSGAGLADMLAELGRFDEAIGHAEVAVQIAEAADHPFTLYVGLFSLGLAHLRRGDLPRATRVLARCQDLGRTGQIVTGIPLVAATLGAAYALAGRADEALPVVVGAVEEFRRRPIHTYPGLTHLCAGMSYLSAGRIDEAAGYAGEALALTRRLGARASEAHALCLAGDIASAKEAEDAESYYRQALALAEPRGMRPLIAHCHLGLGKLHARMGQRHLTQEHLTTAATMYREMGMTYWLEQAEVE